MTGFTLGRIDKRNLAIGLVLVAAGLIMPMFCSIYNFKVYDTLYLAIAENESMYVIYAALKLVLLNSIRSLPHYLGAFFLGESIELCYRGRPLTIIRFLLVCTVIPLVYILIGVIYNIHYDFGVPAVLLIALLIMVEKANLNLVNISKKTLMVALMITAMQFNDVMPALANLPFGRGEASNDIKVVSVLLGADQFLQFAATLLFLLLFCGSVLVCKLIIDENNLKLMNELKEQNERMKTERRIQRMEERTHQELQHLVHDLKTPLTSAQALVSVVKLGREQEGDCRNVEYLAKVESSMENMGAMISEILYADYRTTITVEKLLKLVLAQISNTDYAPLLQYSCQIPHKRLEVNEIRLHRALINVLENAYYAMDKVEGQISLEVTEGQIGDLHGVCIRVRDNGKGIPREQVDSIWEDGFSTRSSHGLGLAFVREVIEGNGGTIGIDSAEGFGTTVTIVLPERVE